MRTLLIFWALFLIFIGQASAQFTVVPVKFAISTKSTTPGTAFKGQTGNGYLPGGFTTNDEIHVSFVLRAFDDAGNRIAIKRPNFPTAKIGLEPLYENQNSIYTAGLGGKQYIDLTGAVFSDPADPNPNPTLGRVWIYGVDLYGNVVTPTGQPISDPNFVLMNGQYKVRSTQIDVWEIRVINANRKVWPQLVSGYNNLRSTRSQFNAFVRVWAGDMRIDSWLNPTNGCTKYPSYTTEALKHPTLYVGNQAGPVQPSLEVVSYAQGQFLLKNARMVTGRIYRTSGTTRLTLVDPSRVQVQNLNSGDTLVTLVDGSGGTTTRHNLFLDGPRCFYFFCSED